MRTLWLPIRRRASALVVLLAGACGELPTEAARGVASSLQPPSACAHSSDAP